jgi:thiosulfate/3-mercaptopyruvate sulfurtransferase
MTTHPTEYAHPARWWRLTGWRNHLKDDGIRVIESNEGHFALRNRGILPMRCISIGAQIFRMWRFRDDISPERFARLCSRYGITPDTTCIF